MDEWGALEKAIEAGRRSPCAKSKRGVVIWRVQGGILSAGWNAPPPGWECDGSETCRRDCSKVCIHAEVAAMRNAAQWGKPISNSEMLHVKVVDGKAVTSGGPSCWQCSRQMVGSGIQGMWLLHEGEDGPYLKRYGIAEFHRLTLEACGLHPHGGPEKPEKA